MSEAFETVAGNGSKATTVTVSRDVLTDVLGSAVAIGEDGIINADLRVIGDFGENLITPTWDTVTGFTGRTETAGLVEFASRVYDPTDKVWVQEDAFAGSVTRASSMNRYAYVEGSPISHVDVLGAYRAAAAMAQQQLSAADYAAFVAGVKAWYATPACVGYYGCQPVFAATQAMQAAQAANFASAMNNRTSPERQSSPVNPDWRPSDQVVNGTFYCSGMAEYDARVCFVEAAASQALVNYTATNGPGSTSAYLLDYWRLQLLHAWVDTDSARQYAQMMTPYWDLDKEREALNPPQLDHTPVLDPWSEHAQDLHNLEAVLRYPWFYGGPVSAYDRRVPWMLQESTSFRNGLGDSFTYYTREGTLREGSNPTFDLLGVAQLERVFSDREMVAEYGGPFGHNFTFIGSPRTKTPPTTGLAVADLLTYADSARKSIENTVGALQTSSIYGDIPLESLEERVREDGTRCVVGWTPRYSDHFAFDEVSLAVGAFAC